VLGEDLEKKYSDFYGSRAGRKILAREAELVEMRIRDRREILSVGCGPAFLEARMKEDHPSMEITGLDISRRMIAQAARSIHFVYGNAEHLGFCDGTFDAALYITSLEFIENYRKALEESHRVLRTGGGVLILLLNPKSSYFRNAYQRRDSYIRRNIKHLNTDEIMESISGYFTIEDEEYSLGMQAGEMVNTDNPELCSLYVVDGTKSE
jgi:ubiquinone/menaquinone biosynthesis C-methylase UbiE